MFTTGSKLFLGATTLSIIATVVYAALKGGDEGWTATVGLITLSLVLVGLTALNFYVRDSNVSATQPDAVASAPASSEVTNASRAPGLSIALLNQSNVSPGGGHCSTVLELNA